jgi:D-alanyl-lipoteichoic acid acyltransferase DltB (MBOAT superfamily)
MFWKRWHISLTQWFRDYIYITLGGNRCSKIRHLFNMLTVWLLTGIWHGADWSFLVWGLGYFILLVIEKYTPLTQKLKNGVLGHIYTLFLVNLLWIPFRANSLQTSLLYIKGMFGGGMGGIEDKAIHFLLLILIGVLLCSNWENILSKYSSKIWFKTIKRLLFIGLAFLAICAAINSVYTPYIYGNF